MSELKFPTRLREWVDCHTIAPEDVLKFRNEVFGDGKVSRDEAEALFALDLSVKETCVEWPDFFVEVLVDYLVYQTAPEGEISDDNARWLMRCLSRRKVVDGPARLEMLVKVIETAKSSPEFLVKCALEQVSIAVLENQGPVAKNRAGEPKVICKSDVDLIRRIIFGYGGDGNLAITRTEAEFLFDLNDKTVEYENDPEWSDLFMRAIANYLMASAGYVVPPRREVFAPWDRSAGVSGFISAIFAGGKEGFMRMYRSPVEVLNDEQAAGNTAFASAERETQKVTQSEVAWLEERIGRDGFMHENEKALLKFLKEESPDVHPSLKGLLDKVA